ncbi:hypothetical protein FNV43_RR20830 [Rhamnella rubrinervis]|uniref:Uncharacterized protein n=1 Tax=Rhamnella rubrinervis TaxID=2594499 RepID=A0A8K0E1H0_9ROSA|nr:hypothetical protein FNV43_RR20830 [Rhamnella rubrinervis]
MLSIVGHHAIQEVASFISCQFLAAIPWKMPQGITWYIPASALTFMAVEFLRDHFNGELSRDEVQEVSTLSMGKKKSSSFQEVA